MVDYTKKENRGIAGAQAETVYDQGLRSHMIRTYNYMLMGLGISGFVAVLATMFPAIAETAMKMNIVFFIGLLGFGFLVLPRMMTMSQQGAFFSFVAYSALLSLAISPIALIYTGESIARVFFITASVFGVMSIFGYTTKKDLTSLGTFASIGLIGVLIAIVVNIFLKSPMLYFIISIASVIASIALTAYDTQKIKEYYYVFGKDAAMLNKSSIIGALQLYGDFVMMFIHLLNLLGQRR
jgi:FtsH-binding integral membrane protein